MCQTEKISKSVYARNNHGRKPLKLCPSNFSREFHQFVVNPLIEMASKQ
jgi:hypothetical protein